ncbi:hypothetical protein C8R47DRAFT_590946 [Mycena vitilis]|nr:hypothetical protein C8R47DRAFT_590946 [Mycena vitilis]
MLDFASTSVSACILRILLARPRLAFLRPLPHPSLRPHQSRLLPPPPPKGQGQAARRRHRRRTELPSPQGRHQCRHRRRQGENPAAAAAAGCSARRGGAGCVRMRFLTWRRELLDNGSARSVA